MVRHFCNSLKTPVLVLVAGTVACSATDLNAPARQFVSPTIVHNILEDAPRLVLQAEAGIYKRGEQDDMLRREAELPGFGGFFISDVGHVVVYMKPAAHTPDALVRSTLYQAYLNRPEKYVREAMANANNAEIRPGQFSLSELIAIENAISHSPVRIPEYEGVGTSIATNRVVLGLFSMDSTDQVKSSLAKLGVPDSAVVIEAWESGQTLSSWTSDIRPLRGGISIEVNNRTLSTSSQGSAGFNVFVSGDTSVNYLLGSAHMVNETFGTNGQVGDTIYQPTRAGDSVPVGFVAYNPAWSTTGCGYLPGTTVPVDFCPTADVMLVGYTGTATGQRAIGTSDYEGLNGGVGSQHIHGWYAVEGVAIPEYIPVTDTGKIHKSGYKTGTTTGGLLLPVVQYIQFVPWNTPGYSKTVLYTNMTRIDRIGFGVGDSGGPVFVENHGSGAPYYAVGIVAIGLGAVDTNGNCKVGNGCTILVTRWDQMEAALGLGTLNPKTYP